MKVDGSLRSLIQGVSQQPARTRLPGQCTAQDNMSSNPVTGLTRRPPMEEIAKLFDDKQTSSTVTMTIAAPGVVTWNSHGLAAGTEIRFTTTGALPTGIVANTTYYVSSSSLGANTFRVSSTRANALAGTNITTTGSQSGVHTATANFLRGAQFYDYDLGEGNQFIVAALPNKLRVFDAQGNEKVVNEVGSTFDYLDGGELAFTTLDDVTYIANRTKTVAMETAVKSYVETGSLVYLLGGQYGRVYTVNIVWSGGTYTASYTAPDGGSAVHSTQITTTYIATQLKTALDAVSGLTTNFTVTRVDDVLYIKKLSSPTTEAFKCTVADGDGGENMLVVNNTIKNANALPRYAPHGYVVTVQGAAVDADDWYLEFIAEKDTAGAYPALGAGFGRNGIWAECVAPQTKYQLDLDTMPHILEYDFGTDEFTFDAAAWENREAGNEDSNANPTFIGKTIEDLAYFQGRLVILSGPAVIMSRTNKPLDFWLNSATILADDDRIDVQSTAKGVRKMIRAIPHNRDLVVFANKGQFIVFGRNQITPKNSALVLTTNFEADMTASPAPAGRNIFFAFKFGTYTGIREFFTQDGQDANDSRPITQHVNKYLEGNVTTLTSTSNFDVLFVQTSTGQTTIYFYEYTWLDDKKVQSSWSRWIMPDPVVYTFITESEVSMITKKDDNYILNRIDLDLQNDAGLTYSVRLDRKLYIPTVNLTVAAPYPVPEADPDSLVFIQGEGCPTPGMRAWVESYDAGSDTYTFDRDMEGGTVICGIRYLSSYIPTNPDVKDSDGVKISTGSLKVSKFILNCKETGKIMARVFSRYFPDRLIEFTGRFVGDPLTHVGEPAITDATYTVPFRENVENAEVEFFSDSHLPFTLSDIQWKGQYTKKGRRIANGGQG